MDSLNFSSESQAKQESEANLQLLAFLKHTLKKRTFKAVEKQLALPLPKRLTWEAKLEDYPLEDLLRHRPGLNSLNKPCMLLKQPEEEAARRMRAQFERRKKLEQSFCVNQRLKPNLQCYEQMYTHQKTIATHALGDFEDRAFQQVVSIHYSRCLGQVVTAGMEGMVRFFDGELFRLETSLYAFRGCLVDMEMNEEGDYISVIGSDVEQRNENDPEQYKLKIFNIQYAELCKFLPIQHGRILFQKFYSLLNRSEVLLLHSKARILIVSKFKGQYLFDFELKLEASSSRRKRGIESVDLHRSGLLAAGLDQGELITWQLNLAAPNLYTDQCVMAIKVAMQKIKQIEFNQHSSVPQLCLLGDSYLKVFTPCGPTLFEDSLSSSRCDFQFSCRSRYILFTFHRCLPSLRLRLPQEVCPLGLTHFETFDTGSLQVVRKFGDAATEAEVLERPEGYVLFRATQLKAHPTKEELFLVAGAEGVVKMVDCVRGTVVWQVMETARAIGEPMFRNEVEVVQFVGERILVGTLNGTISWYGVDVGVTKYLTPTEQFFPAEFPSSSHSLLLNEFLSSPELCNANGFKHVCPLPNSSFSACLSSRISEGQLQDQIQQAIYQEIAASLKGPLVCPGAIATVVDGGLLLEEEEEEMSLDYTFVGAQFISGELAVNFSSQLSNLDEEEQQEDTNSYSLPELELPQKPHVFTRNRAKVPQTPSKMQNFELEPPLKFEQRREKLVLLGQDWGSGAGMAGEVCHFCRQPYQYLIGPFLNEETMEQYFFHHLCLQVNDYVRIEGDSYTNISEALEVMGTEKQCKRCRQAGATVSCKWCRSMFHGHHCAFLSMMQVDDTDYQCFECLSKSRKEVIA